MNEDTRVESPASEELARTYDDALLADPHEVWVRRNHCDSTSGDAWCNKPAGHTDGKHKCLYVERFGPPVWVEWEDETDMALETTGVLGVLGAIQAEFSAEVEHVQASGSGMVKMSIPRKVWDESAKEAAEQVCAEDDPLALDDDAYDKLVNRMLERGGISRQEAGVILARNGITRRPPEI